MKFQEFCVKQIKHALSLGLTREQLDSEAYKLAVKRGFVRVYAETYCLKAIPSEFVFWDIDFGARNIVHGHEVWKSLLCSEKAYALCEAMENHEGWKKVCYEHIEPADVTYNRLVELNGKNPSETTIKRILDRCKLVALTKGEMSLLDKRPYSSFTDEDKRLVEKWHKQGFISAQIKNEALRSMDGSTKMHGTAYARLAHLANKGVTFKWGQRLDLRGGALIAAYLKEHNHNI